MDLIKDFLEARLAEKQSYSDFRRIKKKVVEYMLSSGYSTVEALGYKLKLKESSKTQKRETDELDLLIERLKLKQIELSGKEIYDLQEQIELLQLRLIKLTTTSEISLLCKLRDKYKEEVISIESYDITCLVDSKSSIIFNYVDERTYREMLIQGKEKAGLSKTAICKFIIENGNLSKANWEDYLSQNSTKLL